MHRCQGHVAVIAYMELRDVIGPLGSYDARGVVTYNDDAVRKLYMALKHNALPRTKRLTPEGLNTLLHSKQKRQALISRANNVRLSVKAAIMRDVMNPQQADR